MGVYVFIRTISSAEDLSSGTHVHAQVHASQLGRLPGIGKECVKGPSVGQLWFTLITMKSSLEGVPFL